MRTPSLVAFICSVSVAGCAVTHETTAAQVQLDESVARTQASALTSAISGATDDDGVTVADAVARIGDTASALVPQTRGGAGHRPTVGTTTCTCEASAKRCDFDGCTIRGAVVSGSVAWGDGKIVCTDLVVDVTTSAANAHATLSCDLTYDLDASHLAGTLHTTGSAAVKGSTYAWDASLTADGITVSGGSITAGTLEASAKVRVTAKTATAKDYAATAVVSLP